MPEITIKIEGVEELIRKVGKIDVPSMMRKPMERSMIRLQARMAAYPPQRPGVTYRRTGTLGRRWTYAIIVTGNSITGKIGNNTIYAPFVQSKRFQTAVHRRGGWQTDEDVLREETPAIVRDFERGVQEAVREAGLG